MSILRGALAAQYCLTRRTVTAKGLQDYLGDHGHRISKRQCERILCHLETILPIEWRLTDRGK